MNDMKELDREIDELDNLYRIYAVQWGLSVKALWYYRKGDLYNAVKLTKKCTDEIDKLIKKGMYSLIYRNIEQNKNLGFIQKKLKNENEQQKLKGQILKYYFSGKTKILYGKCFNDMILWNELPYLRDSFGYLTFKENVEKYYDLLKLDQGKAKIFYDNVLERIILCEPTTLERYNIHVWLKIQNAFYKNQYINFLKGMNEFFEEGKEIFYDVFKKVLINQYVKIIDSFEVDEYHKQLKINKAIEYESEKLSSYRVKDFTSAARKLTIE
jgi:hypothetical protein